ncbi:MAG TPA: lytic transglycosylase domain-containing protein, partial [Candidatus Acidoferrum sp.]|nr:lytic transglycosylase domain-containing protein [Candidatus Acidoferrum sp.]
LLLALSADAQNKPSDSIQKHLAAAAIQREAVRKQMELAAQYRATPVAAAVAEGEPATECEPLSPAEITPIIDAAAQQHQVQTAVLRGVIEQESGGRPCAVSPKGARGLMQLMPSVIEQFQVSDAFDPKQNVEAGAQLLKQLLDKYKGDLKLALAAYNAGPGSVDRANGIPDGIPDIKETKEYVDAILKKIK